VSGPKRAGGRPKGLHGRLDDVAVGLFDGRQMTEALAEAETERHEATMRALRYLSASLFAADEAARDVRRLAGGEAHAARAETAAVA
jgi:hypothetical protein